MCIIIAAAYIPTLSGDFILDDLPFVKDNPYLQEFHSLTSYLSQEDGISSERSDQWHSGYYRPLVNVTYTVDFMLWGTNGSGFRATNLILHLLTCLILYRCLNLVATGGRTGAFLSVLMFGLHPANTEAVAWITSRNNILVAFFSLATLYFYIKSKKESKKWEGLLSLTCFSIALLCKEFAVMLLPTLIIYDHLLNDTRKALRERAYAYLAFLIIIVAYMGLRSVALHHLMPGQITIRHIWQSIYFAPFLILENLRVIFVPFGLHNFMIRYPSSYFEKEAILGFVGTGLLLWLLWRHRDNKFVVFSFLSFFTALVPVLNIIPTAAYSLISMRWLYFPMIFLTFFAAHGFSQIDRGAKRVFSYGLLAMALVYCWFFTYILNENLWRTEEDFFDREVVLLGNNFYVEDLARMYQKKGERQKARQYYQIAERRGVRNRNDMFINYAALLVELNEPETALAYLERVQTFGLGKDRLGGLFNNKGTAYARLKDYENAIKSFRKATFFVPEERIYLLNLGNTYKDAKQYPSAEAVFRRYIDLDPKAMPGRIMLSTVYIEMGDCANARKVLEETPVETGVPYPGVQKILEQIIKKQGKGAQLKDCSDGTP